MIDSKTPRLLLAATVLMAVGCTQATSPDGYTDEEADLEKSQRGLLKQLGGTNGDADYCNTGDSRCDAGEGDCDGDGHCRAGLTCVQNVGALYGFSSGLDICSTASCFNGVQDFDEDGIDCQIGPGPCGDCDNNEAPGELGDADYCSYIECKSGQGDCDADTECERGLRCLQNRGGRFDLSSGVDICLPAHCGNDIEDSAQNETGVDCGGPCGSCIVSGDVIINEIMHAPQAVADADGEWFEVYNPNDRPISLDGWDIRDDDTNEHRINFPLVIDPGEYIVLGNNSNTNTNGGIEVDYEYDTLSLNDDIGRVTLVAPNDFIIDAVVYDSTDNFPDLQGQSMTLSRARLDYQLNDFGDAWCGGRSELPSGDQATPGSVNDICK